MSTKEPSTPGPINAWPIASTICRIPGFSSFTPAAARLRCMRTFRRRYRARDRPQGTPGILSPGVPAPALVPAASVPDAYEAALPDGRRLSETAREGFSALSAVPLDRVGAADVVRTSGRPLVLRGRSPRVSRTGVHRADPLK